MQILLKALLFLSFSPMFSCGGETPGGEASTTSHYTIGGTLSGLSGTVVLQNNEGDDLELTADGPFVFLSELEDADTYAITVSIQPDDESCSISNGTGVVAASDVSNISIVCSSITHTVGGTVAGLSGTVVLQNNEGDDLELTTDGPFTFLTELEAADAYAVTVLTQPDDESCSISNGTGVVAASDVSDISIVSSSTIHTVGGTVTGLLGAVVLQNNAGDDLTLEADGDFTFTTAVADGASYNVSVVTNPATQICTVSTNNGIISGVNVTDVDVTCSTNTYTVGGTIAGLAGRTVVLQNNAGDDFTTTANGSFTFATAVADGGAYDVTVRTQPSGGSCSLSGATGTLDGTDVTDITVTCIADNKIIFVTSTAYSNGNLGGLSGADAQCNTLASAASLTGTFSAWLSTSTVNAKDRVSVGHAGGFVLINSTVIASSFSDLLDGSIQNPINRNESSTVISYNTMTGTSQDGTAHANKCNDWTSSSSSISGEWGAATTPITNGGWTDIFSNTCATGNAHLYCFQD
jgi:hypothetical protein